MSKTLTDVNTRGDMDLMKLIDEFGSEAHCRDYLMHLRWPDGPECVKCGSRSLSKIDWQDHPQPDGKVKKGRYQFDCNSCRARFSVTAGTVFHDSHLPLRKWFLAVYMMCESKKGMSANQLKRTLAVSYKTAWYLCHRIRWAMTEANPEPLTGIVEIDETYVGGKARSGSKAKGIGSGNAAKIKPMVLGALERGGRVRFRVETRTASGPVLEAFVHDSTDGKTRAIYTDTAKAYQYLDYRGAKHESVDHSAEEWVRGDVGTQGIESSWSLLKRSIIGSYHQLSAKHLPAYLDEIAFRFNNRENRYLFRDTLRKLISADALTYANLTGIDHRAT